MLREEESRCPVKPWKLCLDVVVEMAACLSLDVIVEVVECVLKSPPIN
jgi:hypothetical protein